jgi:hypothetical protein
MFLARAMSGGTTDASVALAVAVARATAEGGATGAAADTEATFATGTALARTVALEAEPSAPGGAGLVHPTQKIPTMPTNMRICRETICHPEETTQQPLGWAWHRR